MRNSFTITSADTVPAPRPASVQHPLQPANFVLIKYTAWSGGTGTHLRPRHSLLWLSEARKGTAALKESCTYGANMNTICI